MKRSNYVKIIELQTCNEKVNLANGTEWESKLVFLLLD